MEQDMRRSIPTLMVLGALSLSACTPSEVVITAQIEQDDPSQEGATRTLTLENIVVELIPFDRDHIFDSLAAAAPNPEPEIPADLLAAQEEIQAAQVRWQNLEARWNTLRDTLVTINDQLEQFSRGEARYVALYREWQDLEAEYNRIDRQVESAFEQYDSLSKASLAQSQEVKIQRDNWAAEAFAEVDPIWDAYLSASGRDILTDTTSADGIARFEGMGDGDWWVHARFEGPSTELYWNVPISVPKGEVVQLRLSRDNAEERPKL
jgi:hypothetical protein